MSVSSSSVILVLLSTASVPELTASENFSCSPETRTQQKQLERKNRLSTSLELFFGHQI